MDRIEVFCRFGTSIAPVRIGAGMVQLLMCLLTLGID
jgi:hypothetical protein